MRRACSVFCRLALWAGTSIRIIADGSDEEEAVNSLVELVKSGFAE